MLLLIESLGYYSTFDSTFNATDSDDPTKLPRHVGKEIATVCSSSWRFANYQNSAICKCVILIFE